MRLTIALGVLAPALLLTAADQTPPMVPPAGPGVFTSKQLRPNTFKLTVAGHTFTTRRQIEQYLAYRAAQLTIEQGGDWFTLTEDRAKTETADPIPARDPSAPRYSFRMKYFRPVWRHKAAGAAAYERWSPFAGAPFPKTIGDFEVTVDIVVRKGPMDDTDPLAFEARAVSDLLINQVSPPK